MALMILIHDVVLLFPLFSEFWLNFLRIFLATNSDSFRMILVKRCSIFLILHLYLKWQPEPCVNILILSCNWLGHTFVSNIDAGFSRLGADLVINWPVSHMYLSRQLDSSFGSISDKFRSDSFNINDKSVSCWELFKKCN